MNDDIWAKGTVKLAEVNTDHMEYEEIVALFGKGIADEIKKGGGKPKTLTVASIDFEKKKIVFGEGK